MDKSKSVVQKSREQRLVKLWLSPEEFAELKFKADSEKKSISKVVYDATVSYVGMYP